MKNITIAIDGPAGSGKSTIAKAVAKKLNIAYLDTGAMYRSVALKAINLSIDPCDQQSVTEILEDIDIFISVDGENQRIMLDGKDVTDKIRTPEVSRGASDVGVNPNVRSFLVSKQQSIAENQSVIMDGRDIGTHVLPNATYKFFMTADAKVRAQRRLDEFKLKGIEKTFEEVYQDMVSRDENDSNRACAPLRQAEDAILLDTTDMTIAQVIDFVINTIQSRT